MDGWNSTFPSGRPILRGYLCFTECGIQQGYPVEAQQPTGGLPVVLGGTMFRSAQFGFYEAALGTDPLKGLVEAGHTESN